MPEHDPDLEMSHEDDEVDEHEAKDREHDVVARWHADREAESAALVASEDALILRIHEEFSEDQIAAAQLPEGGAQIPNELEPLVGEGVAALRELSANVRLLVAAAQARPAATQTASTWVAIACGVTGSIGTVLGTIYAIKAFYERNNALRIALVATAPDDVQPLIRALEKPTDAEFWTAMAAYVRKFAPRPWDEQLLLNEHSADIYRFTMKATWRWSNAVEKLALTDQLARNISELGIATTYEQMPRLRSGDQPVPRAVAARLISAAICKWHRAT